MVLDPVHRKRWTSLRTFDPPRSGRRTSRAIVAPPNLASADPRDESTAGVAQLVRSASADISRLNTPACDVRRMPTYTDDHEIPEFENDHQIHEPSVNCLIQFCSDGMTRQRDVMHCHIVILDEDEWNAISLRK